MPQQVLRSDGEAAPERTSAETEDVGTEQTLDDIIDTYARE